MKKSVMIFIPAYNAAQTLTKLLGSISPKIYDRISEILLQDNCSTDKTFQLAQEYKKKSGWKKLTLVRNERNLGYGGTKKKAFSYGIAKGHDLILILHADCQYSPNDLWDMIEPLEKGKADLTIGVRKSQLAGGMPFWKFIGNKILTWVENTILGMHLSEWHSGYKVYTTSSLRCVPFQLDGNDHSISSEMIIQYKIAKFRIREVPISTRYGDDVSQCSLKTSFLYGMSVFKNIGLYLLHTSRLVRVPKFTISKPKRSPR